VASRSYEDQCGIARALDVVGERWALLVVRELLYGPKRFSDLHRGLGLISQNVLSDRLRELRAAGVVERLRVGPPASTTVYRLTERGRDLRGILAALGRWGSVLPPAAGAADMSVDAMVFALESTFDPRSAAGLDIEVELRLPGDSFVSRVRDSVLTIRRGTGAAVDLVLDLDVAALAQAAFGRTPLAGLVGVGRVRCQGPLALAERFFACFSLPRRP
jgi:DNA-binding HxlR family transcriptional regulator